MPTLLKDLFFRTLASIGFPANTARFNSSPFCLIFISIPIFYTYTALGFAMGIFALAFSSSKSVGKYQSYPIWGLTLSFKTEAPRQNA